MDATDCFTNEKLDGIRIEVLGEIKRRYNLKTLAFKKYSSQKIKKSVFKVSVRVDSRKVENLSFSKKHKVGGENKE